MSLTSEPGKEEEKLKNITIRKVDVLKKINKLKKTKSPGPDEIFPRVLKECREQISGPLVNLFTKSLDMGVVPDLWKQANVVPIFKTGDRASASNYRPISLTSVVGKFLESIIADSIRSHLEKSILIYDSQHGFTKGKSCLTNLQTFFRKVFEVVDNDENYDVIYLDFSKAFDRVPHQRKVLNWIKSWLTDRTQRVSVDGVKSEWGRVTSGVPQGSVLGPLLFIIYINDLDTGISSDISKFADDTKIGRQINSGQDANALQEDLNKLQGWSEKWQMKFNTSKCSVLNIGRTNTYNVYSLNNINLEKSTCERDRGVLVSPDLRPRKQVLGFISRSVSNKSAEVLLQLYLSLVRPHLDYAVQFWCPNYRMDINSLESVQLRMTKIIPGLRNLPYQDRLKKLNLHSLERRRVRGDMIEVFKWVKGINKGDIDKDFIISEQDKTRSNGFKLDKFRFRREIGRNWFTNRVVDEWNKLSNFVVSAGTLKSFKRRLDRFMDDREW
ncbi:RNA-directed DNA polymerase from mobile element jockey-like 30 [Homarus americanus]|uniref:RNA-directed DNA polymerase from mobile element jockey-like 30 n=1 Tax=Homarus americanus TaxID=6706 RepID=A0A8J5MX94_HOMAM|nr:RNA-directed DNA polymerase from mobile element jockey-like 30 [Homarus americanus]